MSRYTLLFIIASLFSVFFTLNAQAQTDTTTTTTVVEKKTIVTPPPKSASCATVAAHWEGDTWIDTQTICQYSNRTEGVAWVQDYWACTAATATGDCTAWQFMPGHWIKTMPQ